MCYNGESDIALWNDDLCFTLMEPSGTLGYKNSKDNKNKAFPLKSSERLQYKGGGAQHKRYTLSLCTQKNRREEKHSDSVVESYQPQNISQLLFFSWSKYTNG